MILPLKLPYMAILPFSTNLARQGNIERLMKEAILIAGLDFLRIIIIIEITGALTLIAGGSEIYD